MPKKTYTFMLSSQQKLIIIDHLLKKRHQNLIL